MWLTLIWQNKGLIAVASLVLLVLGLMTAIKVQSSRLDSQKAANKTLENERDVAIDAHDQLVKEIDRQRQIVADREIAREQQEKDYARLQRTLAEALRNARVWADTRLPDGVREAITALPEASPGDTGNADKPDVGAKVPGAGQ